MSNGILHTLAVQLLERNKRSGVFSAASESDQFSKRCCGDLCKHFRKVSNFKFNRPSATELHLFAL